MTTLYQPTDPTDRPIDWPTNQPINQRISTLQVESKLKDARSLQGQYRHNKPWFWVLGNCLGILTHKVKFADTHTFCGWYLWPSRQMQQNSPDSSWSSSISRSILDGLAIIFPAEVVWKVESTSWQTITEKSRNLKGHVNDWQIYAPQPRPC